MKSIKLLFILALFLTLETAYSQNPFWVLHPFKKFDTRTRQLSNLPSNGSNTLDATKGLFDTSGDLVFGVQGQNIIDQNGTIVHTIALTGNQTFLQDALIVPVPGGNCGEYYILCSSRADRQTPFGSGAAHVDGYNIAAIRVTVDDATQQITIGATHQLYYSDTPTIIPRFTRLAVSKEANGERTLYASMTTSASPSHDTRQIVKIRVNGQGISKNGAFYDIKNTHNMVASPSLELSPSGRYLAFMASSYPAGFGVVVLNVNTGSSTKISHVAMGDRSAIEFLGDNQLYVTTTQGVFFVEVSSQNISVVPNTSNGSNTSIYYGGDIERISVENFDFYVSATNGQMGLIKWWFGSTFTPNVAFYSPGTELPQQIYGEAVIYRCNQNNGGGGIDDGNDIVLPVGGSVLRTTKSTSLLNKPALTIFPNPVVGQLNIKVSNEEKIVQVQIFSFNGKQVRQIKGSRNRQQQINVSDLAKGIYTISIQTDQRVSRQKLVVK